MSKNTAYKPRDWREGRRIRAWELKQLGWTQKEIAIALGVTPGAVSQWMKRAKEGGAGALRTRPRSGRPPKLGDEQRSQLPALLESGAEAYGFRGDLWTTERVAEVIARQFGVRYHPAHVSRILRELGWTVQRPVRRATQRDEGAIKAWQEERWPALKKRPSAKVG